MSHIFQIFRPIFMSSFKAFSWIIFIYASIVLLSICFPASASAIGLGELENELVLVQQEVDESRIALDSVNAELGDVAWDEEKLLGANSAGTAQATSAIVSLYKLKSERDLLFEMVLRANTLDEALRMWESYDSIAASCEQDIAQMRADLNDLTIRRGELEKKRAEVETALSEKEKALEDAKMALDEKKTELEELFTSSSDNATMARVACSLAYSKRVSLGDGYPGTSAYSKAWSTIFSDERRVFHQGRSCDRGVATAVRLAGFDDSFPRSCSSQYPYLQKSDRWADLGLWDGKESSLMPGDVLVRLAGKDGAEKNHTCMYVGYDIAQQVYEQVIRGTEGDLGQPAAKSTWASSARGNGGSTGRALCICKDGDTAMHVFRCISPQHSTTYSVLLAELGLS